VPDPGRIAPDPAGRKGSRNVTSTMSHSQESRTVNDHQRLAELAEKHLWGHFSVLKNEVDGTRVIERG
ncbi:uncharacterized protein METZ01_LOCUS102618, partial [marine metagenome]